MPDTHSPIVSTTATPIAASPLQAFLFKYSLLLSLPPSSQTHTFFFPKQLLFHKPTPFSTRFHFKYHASPCMIHFSFISSSVCTYSLLKICYPPVPMPKRIVRNCHRPPFLFMVYYKNTRQAYKNVFRSLSCCVESVAKLSRPVITI